MPQPLEILQQYWGHTQFRGSQEKIIKTILSGHDCIALMPTGGGKSLCFQIPALAVPGLCVVVSPLVALIQNQVDTLKSKGIKAIALTGGLTHEAIGKAFDNCQFGQYKFLYLSPERLMQEIVQQRLRQINVNLLVIDEAHCISQWGHDFRPAYLNCGILKELHPQIPMIALTATATQRTLTDIIEQLGLPDPMLFKDSFARDNLTFKVFRTQDPHHALLQSLNKKAGSGIVYVRTRRNTALLSDFLNENGHSADFFHGGLSPDEKKKKLHTWLSSDHQIMVATNAFGMGIDKHNVRNVVHYQIPDSIENYFQEVGRAGRDGEPAHVTLLSDETRIDAVQKQFMDLLPKVPFLKQLYRKLNTYFQIAYGEGEGQEFDFEFYDFSQRYGFNTALAYNALRLLDQNSIIALSEAFYQKTSIRFLAPKDALFRYLQENPSLQQLIQTLLRTYGGLFDFDTKLNLSLISKKISQSKEHILRSFEKLEQDGIITYTSNKSDLTLTFLVPREDDKTINRVAQKVDLINKQKQERLKHMLLYVTNESICRSKFLLQYFGEKVSENCGKCDLCLSAKSDDAFSLENTKEGILKLLRMKECSSRELLEQLKHPEQHLIKAIQELLEDQLIFLTTYNTYGIRTKKG